MCTNKLLQSPLHRTIFRSPFMHKIYKKILEFVIRRNSVCIKDSVFDYHTVRWLFPDVSWFLAGCASCMQTASLQCFSITLSMDSPSQHLLLRLSQNRMKFSKSRDFSDHRLNYRKSNRQRTETILHIVRKFQVDCNCSWNKCKRESRIRK